MELSTFELDISDHIQITVEFLAYTRHTNFTTRPKLKQCKKNPTEAKRVYKKTAFTIKSNKSISCSIEQEL